MTIEKTVGLVQDRKLCHSLLVSQRTEPDTIQEPVFGRFVTEKVSNLQLNLKCEIVDFKTNLRSLSFLVRFLQLERSFKLRINYQSTNKIKKEPD